MFTNYSFLAQLAWSKSFNKYNEFWWLKCSQNISSFISFLALIISSLNFSCNFNLDVLCLVGTGFGAGSSVCTGAGSDPCSCASSGAGSGACSGVVFFIGNILLLK